MRISSTLLQRGAAAGLTLAQIGQILCRPDEDDSLPSLLERIVEKARLIADMMCKMQTKIKDTNLRSIDMFKKVKKQKTLNDSDEDDSTLEEFKNGSPGHRQKRNRTNSIIEGQTTAFGKGKLNNQLFASISAAIGFEEDQPYKVEAKQRGMSDVDDTNIRQLQNNTSNMI